VNYFGDSELETVSVLGSMRNILASFCIFISICFDPFILIIRTLGNRRRNDTKLKFGEITFNLLLLFTDAKVLLHHYMKETP
jgi:hypothetical protein